VSQNTSEGGVGGGMQRCHVMWCCRPWCLGASGALVSCVLLVLCDKKSAVGGAWQIQN